MEATTKPKKTAKIAAAVTSARPKAEDGLHPADAKPQTNERRAVRVRKFPDGYDLDFEANALKKLIDADEPDPADPLYARYEVYLERLDQWNAIEEQNKARRDANPEVPVREAAKVQYIGGLTASGEDTMTIHTMEAMRLYMGARRIEKTDQKSYSMPGARQAAGILRQIFILTSKDNPYADWQLVQVDDGAEAIKEAIAKEKAKNIKIIEDARMNGMNYSILKSKQPQTVGMGFRSAYGHTVSMIVALFDQAVLAIKSCEYRDLISKDQSRDSIAKLKRGIRALFIEINRTYVLLKPEMRELSRLDFAEGSDEQAGKRVLAAQQLFGKVPTDVFTGKREPRHSMRRVRLSPGDKRLLEEMASQDVVVAETSVSTEGLIE